MTAPKDLTAPQAEALLALVEAERLGRGFCFSSNETDLDRCLVASGSAFALARRGLASSDRTGRGNLTVVYRLTNAGRELAGFLCRIHEPNDPACGETEECPRPTFEEVLDR